MNKLICYFNFIKNIYLVIAFNASLRASAHFKSIHLGFVKSARTSRIFWKLPCKKDFGNAPRAKEYPCLVRKNINFRKILWKNQRKSIPCRLYFSHLRLFYIIVSNFILLVKKCSIFTTEILVEERSKSISCF